MTDPTRFAAPRRLHPASIVLGLPARQLIQVIVFPVIVTFAGSSPSLANGVQLFLLYAGVGLTVRTVGYQRRVFSFDGETLRLNWGVLSRQQRTIAVERIQQIELRRSAVSRALGLSTVRIETAGSATEPEVELRVITHTDAKALRDAVRARTGADHDDGSEQQPLLTVKTRQLVLAAVTGNRLLALPGVVFAGFQFVGAQLGTFIEDVVQWLSNPPDALATFETVLSAVAFPLVIATAVGASVLSAVTVTLLRDGRFTITRRGDELRITRGLLATRDSLIAVNRIQLIELKQNWLRRLFGVVTVRLQSAGGDADARVLIPLLRRDHATTLIDAIMTDMTRVPLIRHPKAAQYRSVLRWLRYSVPVLLVVIFRDELAAVFPVLARVELTELWQAGAVSVVVGMAIGMGLASYRMRGHAVTESLVIAQTGTLNRRYLIAPIRKIQTVGIRANVFQRRLNLATLLVRVAGARSTVVVHDAAATMLHDYAQTLTVAASMPSSSPGRR